tara:strand:- start:8493 stop:10541 length:2049 start_codon:yes stop_codon:yes gene_type:complete
MQKRILWQLAVLCLSFNLSSQYIYEGNQSLIDLTNQTGTTNLNVGDDQLSPAFNLDFTFNFYDQQFTSARMATNGCLHFGLGTGNVNYNNYCGDYTPDPLPQYNYTLFPFWTDLIRDNQSKMLAKNFSDKTVFGWYNLKEYNRNNTDNSFEVILWTNSSFDFRYGGLNIIQHDVLIGEQKDSDTYYQYLFYDECNTGTTNSSSCVNVNWNNSSFNTLLENGGSLYGSGSGNNLNCSNPLNDTSCPGYWEAYDDLQCDLDPQYAPFCRGYRQEESVAFFDEEMVDYGFVDEQEQFATGIFIDEQFGYEDFEEYDTFFEYDTFENDEVYLIELEPIAEGYEEIFDWEEPYEEYVEVWNEPEEIFVSLEPRNEFVEVFDVEELINLYEFETIIREEIDNDVRHDETNERESFETLEELEEWFEEELEEIQQDDEIDENTESREELLAEVEENIEEENTEEKSSVRRSALAVVASTIQTARDSVYTTVHGNTSTSGVSSSGMSSSASSSSTGSISNSPSISDQFSSSTTQTNQILDMTTTVTTSSTATMSSNISSISTTSVSDNTTTSQSIQDTIDVSISNQADEDVQELVETIIAANLQQAQEEVETQQQETGEYGSEDTIIAYMSFVPNFNTYATAYIPQQEQWYESTDIYSASVINDNIEAFYGLAGQSIQTLTEIKNLQPNL